MATIVLALSSCAIRPIKRAVKKSGPCFALRDIVVDFLNGTVIVPFTLLIGATFSKTILEEALKSNKLFLAIGGVIGLLFVLREYFHGE
jgi:uncharacterized membrane protein YdcZ (DUF606 family)